MAFFHVLRQHALSKDDQAFLFEHAKVLTIHDLLAWRSRCDEGFHRDGDPAARRDRRRRSSALRSRGVARASALACLDPPSRFSRSIHDLKRAVDTEGDALTLIELNARLVKHARAREATFESVIAALQGLADARLGAA